MKCLADMGLALSTRNGVRSRFAKAPEISVTPQLTSSFIVDVAFFQPVQILPRTTPDPFSVF